MTRGLYFYDQYTRVSHLGGIQRYKRHHDELNQALHQHRIAVAADSDQTGNVQPVTPAITIGQTPSPNKQQLQFAKQTNEHLLKSIQRRFQSSFVPDLLFKELDRFFQRYDDDESGGVSSEATPKVSSSNIKKSKMSGDQDKDDEENVIVDEVEDDQDLINRAVNRPKLSLPASLILRLHSSWADLIEDTRYRYPVRRFLMFKNEMFSFSLFLKNKIRFGERKAAKTNGIVKLNDVESKKSMQKNNAHNP